MESTLPVPAKLPEAEEAIAAYAEEPSAPWFLRRTRHSGSYSVTEVLDCSCSSFISTLSVLCMAASLTHSNPCSLSTSTAIACVVPRYVK